MKEANNAISLSISGPGLEYPWRRGADAIECRGAVVLPRLVWVVLLPAELLPQLLLRIPVVLLRVRSAELLLLLRSRVCHVLLLSGVLPRLLPIARLLELLPAILRILRAILRLVL